MPWADGDNLSPENLNLRGASASSVTGFSSNTIRGEGTRGVHVPAGTALAIGTNPVVSSTNNNQFLFYASRATNRADFEKVVSGTLTETDDSGHIYDTITIQDTRDGVMGSGYSYVGAGADVRALIGWNTGHRGTYHGLGSRTQIKSVNTDATANVRSEFAGLLCVVNAYNGSSNGSINIWGIDMDVYGPKEAQEGYLAGPTVMIGKYHPGKVIDAAHAGSTGMAIVTVPDGGGGVDDGKSTLSSYPIDTGLVIAGWSGGGSGSTQTASSGTDSDASYGFVRGIQVGGRGSAWIGSGYSSKIGTGIQIEDYDLVGLKVASRHPDASSAIGIDLDEASVGRETTLRIQNTDNTNITSHAKAKILSGGAGGGDPTVHFEVTGVTQWLVGIDNDAGDVLKIETGGNSIGSGTNVMVLTADGIGLATTPTAPLHVSGSTIRIATAKTPASGTASGNTGDVVWDSGFVYVCASADSWRRAALSAF